MSLAILINALEKDLVRYTRVFAEVRATRSELVSVATARDVNRALDRSSSLSQAARRALVTVLVEEARKPAASPVWAALLALAFTPMLHTIRRTMNDPGNPDHDSLLFTAFFGAVRSVPIDGYTTLSLERATRKAVFRQCEEVWEEEPAVPFDDDQHGVDLFSEFKGKPVFDKMIAAIDANGETELLDVLVCTRGQDESLKAYVARTVANKRERPARYEQLRRERRRFEREVRARLKGAA